VKKGNLQDLNSEKTIKINKIIKFKIIFFDFYQGK